MSDQVKAKKPWWKTWRGAVAAVVAFVVIAGIFGESPEEQAKTNDARATEQTKKVPAAEREPTAKRQPEAKPKPPSFRERVSKAAGVEAAGEWWCPKKSELACEVAMYYVPSGFGSDLDATIEATRPLFEQAFKERPKHDVMVGVYGDVVTVGGKEKKAEVLSIYCRATANKEIVWDRVEADGLRQLCSVNKRVQFDD